MARQLRHHRCLTFLVLALAVAAGCEGEGSAPPSLLSASGSNQPSGGGGGNSGAMNGTSGAVQPAPRDDTAADPGAGGAQGSAEAPGNEGGGAGSAPACSDDTDSDGDGTPDCSDGCPEDANKLEAGECGCGVRDSDIDFDGTLDCREMCPGDPEKIAPGLCGCGRADVDTDGDGELDCNDACPFDATHVELGACGCGAPDNLALCLRHRYSFDGAGAVATDSIGDADGDIIGAQLAGSGALVLAGGATDQYVNLPAGVISQLGVSATIEAWVTWTGAGAPWQRIFDFGSSDQPAGTQGTGVTYLFLTPSNTINTDLRLAFTNAGPPNERVVNAPTPLPFAVAVHVAVVIDGPAQSLSLYQNGALIGTAPTLDTTLGALNDVNNWIGRSQFIADEAFQGVLDEFRIYSVARSAAQIAAETAAGPDDLPPQ